MNEQIYKIDNTASGTDAHILANECWWKEHVSHCIARLPLVETSAIYLHTVVVRVNFWNQPFKLIWYM